MCEARTSKKYPMSTFFFFLCFKELKVKPLRFSSPLEPNLIGFSSIDFNIPFKLNVNGGVIICFEKLIRPHLAETPSWGIGTGKHALTFTSPSGWQGFQGGILRQRRVWRWRSSNWCYLPPHPIAVIIIRSATNTSSSSLIDDPLYGRTSGLTSWEIAAVFFLEGGVEGALVFLFRGRPGGGIFCFAGGAGAVGGGGRGPWQSSLLSSCSSDREEEEGGGVGKTNFMCWSFWPLLVWVVPWLVVKCWIGPLIYPLLFFVFINWAMGISTEPSEEDSLLLVPLPCCLLCVLVLISLFEFAN